MYSHPADAWTLEALLIRAGIQIIACLRLSRPCANAYANRHLSILYSAMSLVSELSTHCYICSACPLLVCSFKVEVEGGNGSVEGCGPCEKSVVSGGSSSFGGGFLSGAALELKRVFCLHLRP